VTIVSKSQLAEHLQVTRSAVSNYVSLGLPVREDGKIDLEAALNWISANVVPHHYTKGAAAVPSARANVREQTAKSVRSRRSEPSRRKGAPPLPPGFDVLDKIENPAAAMAVFALLSALTEVGAKASMAAYGAGASREIAERAGEIMNVMFVVLIEDFVANHDILDPKELMFPHPKFFDGVAWDALGAPGEFAKGI
jgi:hypothetical protein